MSENSVFDALVSSLSAEERRDMVERIRRTITADDEPIERPLDPAESDVEYAYATMGLWRRLLVLLRMLLGAVSRSEAVEQVLLQRVSRKLRVEAPHLIDVGSSTMLPGFKSELERLTAAVAFFRGPVNRVRSSGIGAFYSFLLTLEAPDIGEDLMDGVDPFVLSHSLEDADEHELHREADRRLAEQLHGIPAWIRGNLKQNAVFFESLEALTQFDFGRLLGCFHETATGAEDGDGEGCRLEKIRAPLVELGRLLKGVSPAPTPALVQGLALFGGSLAGSKSELESVTNDRVMGMQSRLDVVRSFGRRVPLSDLLRFAMGNVAYRLPDPPEARGWYARVERFWSRRMESLFQLYSFERKKADLLSQAAALVGEAAEIVPVPGYPAREGARSGTHAAGVGLLRALLSPLRQENTAATLKILFVQGTFYKEENRAEFNEYYAELEALAAAVDTFIGRLAEGGDLRAALAAAERKAGGEGDGDAEESAGPAGASLEDRDAVLDRVDEDADRLLRRAIETLHGLSEVIRGVLYGEVGGKYDTLSNLEEIAGQRNKEFRSELDGVLAYVKSAAAVLAGLYDVERTSARRRAALTRTVG
ncbi:MAG: DUF5312 family protein [Spirochaetaceae bacterium]